ncbi:translation initiation factor IF-2-like [Manacus candei]|uniref:translation initiation factor IF-2-like n=1 Tax=Manacus candei TaxID=415023 RepID=UPI0022273A78|nr:translation initiation factor IF-2-like [Manacus candei]
MVARGPLPSERRLSYCLTSAPTQTPAPRPQRRLAAPLPAVETERGARRRRARAAGSRAAAGTGAGSPLSAPRRAAHARGPQADTARRPPRSAPLPVGPAVPWRCYRGCAAAFPPRKRPTAADPTSGSAGDRRRVPSLGQGFPGSVAAAAAAGREKSFGKPG